MSDDKTQGLRKKYDVRRVDDPTGKHAECFFFVLDPAHDEHARVALRAYAESCRADYPLLAADLDLLATAPGGSQ